MGILNTQTISLDQEYELQEYPVIPQWAYDRIDENDDVQLLDVFPSEKNVLAARLEGFTGNTTRELYPVTVFSLIQLLVAERGSRYFTLYEIMEQHKNGLWEYEYKYNEKTYRGILRNLVEVNILEELPSNKRIKYQIPDNESVAPAFDPDNADSILDDIVVDPPTKQKEEYQNTWIPISLQSLEVNPKDAMSGPFGFGTLWHSSWMFLATWFLLSVAWASRPWMETFDPTASIIVVFWALISVATASLVVDTFDQGRRGYQTSMQQ